jgi:hypothetical protein
MAAKYMKKDKWYQVGGDVNAVDYGAILARWDGWGIEFMRIDSVLDCVGKKEAFEVQYPFWISFGYRDGEKTKPTVQRAAYFAYAESPSDVILYEDSQAVWGKEVVRHLGSVSRVNWYAKQGHGFRSADAEFRREVLNNP